MPFFFFFLFFENAEEMDGNMMNKSLMVILQDQHGPVRIVPACGYLRLRPGSLGNVPPHSIFRFR